MTTLIASILLAVLPTGREWQDNQALSYGKEPTRAAFSSFKTIKSALRILPEFSERTRSLDSESDWKFNWAKDPASRPQDFFKPDFDVSTWPSIKVPCSWQAYGANGKGGWGTALYTNIPYPFEKDVPGGSIVTNEPPKHYTAYAARNPVGSYRREFEVSEEWMKEDVFLKFDGVDSFFYLWVNGEYVGFSKDSRSPAEFEVTKYVHAGKNIVALEVYRYSDGSYLEDQDMFRLSGIFRHTWLLSRPKDRIRDFFVTAKPVDEGDLKGDWLVTVDVEGNPSITLYSATDRLIVRSTEKKFVMKSPKLWSAEEPNYYKIVLGNRHEYVSAIFGFRVSEIKNGRFHFNGQKIKLKGANRHETDPMFGHYVPRSRMEQDLELLKRANCNAVRNSHYPQDDYWYYLCNTKGIYLVDEANVESHGYETNSLSRQPSWQKAMVDRNRSLVERNKNHPSVIIWSYGNESGGGDNFAAVEKWIKSRDLTRPTHYEGGNEFADMFSIMYPSVEWVQTRAKDTQAAKPTYLCEYAHNMINAMGNLKDYQEAIESTDVILGSTIWDWVDQGLYRDKNGKRIIAFGGDFGDQPNDGQFVMNGCVLSDRTPEPGYYEIKHVFQNWTAELDVSLKHDASKPAIGIRLRNKNYFVDSSEVTATWSLLKNGEAVETGAFLLSAAAGPIGPQKSVVMPLPKVTAKALSKAQKAGDLVSLRVSFMKRGEEIASDQIDLTRPTGVFCRAGEAQGDFEFTETQDALIYETKNAIVSFSKETGLPSSIRRKGWFGSTELLRAPFKLNAFRAPSSNEPDLGEEAMRFGFPWFGAEMKELKIEKDGFSARVEWKGRHFAKMIGYGGPEITLEDRIERKKPISFMIDLRWTVGEEFACVSSIHPVGPTTDLLRIGYAFIMDEKNAPVAYLGLGPFENYADRKSGAFLGFWRANANDFYFPYARNENCGNHEGTYGVSVGGLTLRTLGHPFAFEVNPYTSLELVEHVHPTELPEPDKTHVGIYAATRGLGGGSCGPGPLERDIIRTDRDYNFMFVLSLGNAENGSELLPMLFPRNGKNRKGH